GGEANGEPTRNPLKLFGRAWDRGYERLAHAYSRVLRVAIGGWARWAVVGVGVLSFVAGILLVSTGLLGTEFMPEADNGEMQVTIEMPAGTTLDVTNAAAQTVEQRLLALPEVDQVFSSVGIGGHGGFGSSRSRFASIFVQLRKKNQRVRTPAELSNVARTFGADIPGAVIKASSVGMFNYGGASVSVRIQ